MASHELIELPPVAGPLEHEQVDLPLNEPAASLPGDLRADEDELPSFVRRAERAARWRRPWVRAALALASVLLGLTLAGQWVWAERDLVAARHPALRPALASACALLGCELRAPRLLEALRVESSGIARVDKSDLYRLTVALRNLRGHDVALPAFELALTDTQGQLIARRVLSAAELGARGAQLNGNAEMTLQNTLQVSLGAAAGGGAPVVAGYTIELFYP